TNRTEDEADISDHMDLGHEFVFGMTVHKSKGLEFDTVLIPFTHRPYRQQVETELLLDESGSPCKVGWSQVVRSNGNWGEIKAMRSNDYYLDCIKKEFHDVDREEARLLYVAMTRSIRKLECFLSGDDEHSWAHLLGV
ncbi:MAG: 3'-5' exonuclease, partial [Eubacteriales bacterium]|nr:3'-5' exonuclease [Eubacteriales bacterium]